jgi:hypothetical protein
MASTSEVRQRGSGPGRDLNAARVAYDALDVDLSKVAHDAKKAHGSAEAHAGASGKYVKSLVFGGLDGIITTFAVVAASVGGSLGTNVILLMGFSNLVADGLSMGFGDYLSSKAEFEYTRAEHKREKWELDVRARRARFNASASPPALPQKTRRVAAPRRVASRRRRRRLD